MSEALWIVVIVNILAVLSVWIKAYFDYKAKKTAAKKEKIANKEVNPGNPPIPGETEICNDNRDLIIETKTKVEKIEKEIIAIFRILNKR